MRSVLWQRFLFFSQTEMVNNTLLNTRDLKKPEEFNFRNRIVASPRISFFIDLAKFVKSLIELLVKFLAVWYYETLLMCVSTSLTAQTYQQLIFYNQVSFCEDYFLLAPRGYLLIVLEDFDHTIWSGEERTGASGALNSHSRNKRENECDKINNWESVKLRLFYYHFNANLQGTDRVADKNSNIIASELWMLSTLDFLSWIVRFKITFIEKSHKISF